MTEDRVLPSPDIYASCPDDGKILSYYSEQFEVVYIVLHPFLRPKSDRIEYLKTKEDWFSDSQILQWFDPVGWTEFLHLSGIDNWQNLDGALRNYIFGISDRERFQSYTDALIYTLERENLFPPYEGEIPCVLMSKIRRGLHSLGYKWVWLGDEFCTERKLEWIDDLETTEKIPCHGCIFTPDHKILMISHWDSHCTFFCSSREKISTFLAQAKLEGFYCTPQTEVYWGLYEI